jgi:hypothetical protein
MSAVKVIYNMINLALNLLLRSDFCKHTEWLELIAHSYTTALKSWKELSSWPTVSGTSAPTACKGHWTSAGLRLWRAKRVGLFILITVEDKTTVDGVFEVLIGSCDESKLIQNRGLCTRVVWIIFWIWGSWIIRDFGGVVWIITETLKYWCLEHGLFRSPPQFSQLIWSCL